MKIRPLYFCIIILALALGASSCAKKIVYSTPPGAKPASALPGHKAADPQKALQRYTKYLETTGVGDPGRHARGPVQVSTSGEINEIARVGILALAGQEELRVGLVPVPG